MSRRESVEFLKWMDPTSKFGALDCAAMNNDLEYLNMLLSLPGINFSKNELCHELWQSCLKGSHYSKFFNPDNHNS